MYMDSFEFTLGILIILISGVLIYSWIKMRTKIAEAKLAEEIKVSQEKRRIASLKYKQSRNEQESASDLGTWVPELLSSFGVSPDILFSDEMPQELKKLLPLVKGFVDSGGVQKLMAGVQQPGQSDREAI